MNGFFTRLGDSLRTFMVGRYGIDSMSVALAIAAVVLTFLDSLLGIGALSIIAFALFVYVVFRCYSTNIPARTRELENFESVTRAPRRTVELAGKRWKNRKTTCYFTCKKCGTVYSVPKGKGKLRVTCPNCHEQTFHTT